MKNSEMCIYCSQDGEELGIMDSKYFNEMILYNNLFFNK